MQKQRGCLSRPIFSLCKDEKVYFGGVTLDKLKENGLEINPENEKIMREKLRSELGMGAYAKILLPKIKELSMDKNVVLDGLYSV